MPVMDGYDYDEYTLFITLPHGAELDDVLTAGCKALGIEYDPSQTEISWQDSHYI